MKVDLHCHTKYSGDNDLEPEVWESRPEHLFIFVPQYNLSIGISLKDNFHNLIFYIDKNTNF